MRIDEALRDSNLLGAGLGDLAALRHMARGSAGSPWLCRYPKLT